MNKLLVFLICFILCFLFLFYDYFKLKNSEYYNFYSIPILNDGRIKPLGVVSNVLRDFSYNVSVDKLFADVIFNSSKSLLKINIKIRNRDVFFNLGLNYKPEINIIEVFDSLRKNIDLINILKTFNFNKLTSSQKELLEIYSKTLLLFDLTNCLNLTNYNNNSSKYNTLLQKHDKNVISLLECETVKVIPLSDLNWISVSDLFKLNNFFAEEKLNILDSMCKSYSLNDLYNWNVKCLDFKKSSISKLSKNKIIKLELEVLYNNFSLVKKSVVLFILCLIFSLFNRFSSIIAVCVFFNAVAFQFLDILFRIILTAKPPVTSLYDSIIFISCFFALIFIFFIKRKNFKNILLFSSIFSIILSMSALWLGNENLKPVMAVLNTNFWLTTHVLIISIGYVMCLVSGFLSHVYLFFLFKEKVFFKMHNILYNLVYSFALLALFFSFVGTLLGGLWADQSWGRFWGWDPKENGALLIVLWLTLILHLRISNIISSFIFVVSNILNVIVLLLAWFGVNLLNVGLHSYGFIENIGKGLFISIFIEFLYIGFFLFYYYLIMKGQCLSNKY